MRALHREERGVVAEVVAVRRQHGWPRIDVERVLQAHLVRQRARTQSRDVMRHGHRLGVRVSRRMDDVEGDREGVS
jgi:hypothetical protein